MLHKKDAEKKLKMDHLVKLNALRSKSQKKRKGIEEEDQNIENLHKKLKKM